MNKPQKFMVLLWVMVTILAVLMPFVVTESAFRMQYFGIYGYVSVFLWGMVWVFADKKK